MKKIYKNNKFFKENLIIILIFILLLGSIILFTGFFDFFSKHILPNITWGLYNEQFFKNVLVEAHEMLLEIIVLSIILILVISRVKKRERINKYAEQIDDFRYWRDEEAKFRIIGILRRLNELRIFKLNLNHCYLNRAELHDINLSGSTLILIDAQGSIFTDAILENTNFLGADFRPIIELPKKDITIDDSENSKDIKIRKTHFARSKLRNSIFDKADLTQAEFTNADLKDVSFKFTNLKGCDLEYAVNLKSGQLLNAFSLYKARLPEEIKNEIKKTKPELLLPSKTAFKLPARV
jgi:uncharacterized protein YjbI with pentapeptide repeats